MNKNDIEILKKIDNILDSHRNCKGLATFYNDFLKYKELVKKAELQYNNKCKRALKYKHNNKEILNVKKNLAYAEKTNNFDKVVKWSEKLDNLKKEGRQNENK